MLKYFDKMHRVTQITFYKSMICWLSDAIFEIINVVHKTGFIFMLLSQWERKNRIFLRGLKSVLTGFKKSIKFLAVDAVWNLHVFNNFFRQHIVLPFVIDVIRAGLAFVDDEITECKNLTSKSVVYCLLVHVILQFLSVFWAENIFYAHPHHLKAAHSAVIQYVR